MDFREEMWGIKSSQGLKLTIIYNLFGEDCKPYTCILDVT